MGLVECRSCGELMRGNREDLKARCPRCREPLFERAGGPRLVAERDPADEGGICVVHPGNAAVGTCQRCGNFLCSVCRTRWHDRAVCLGCVERALQAHEAAPEEVRAHRRQAVLSLVFGLCAWGLVLLSGLPFLTASGGRPNEAALMLAGAGMLLSLLPAVFGVGQGAAAIRARGDRLIVATCGLVLSGSHLGVLLGLLLLGLWRQ